LIDLADELSTAIRKIEDDVDADGSGLPEELFLFVSRITPLINVDLLIQNKYKRTLLTWRDDHFYGPGWHVPGGIIRYKETAEDRIRSVARQELGVEIDFDPSPIFVLESISPERRDRGHFVSLLYRCRLKSKINEMQRFKPEAPAPDQWLWHDKIPENLIQEQQAYAKFIGNYPKKRAFLRSLTNHIPPSQLARYLIVGIWNTAFAYGSFALFTFWLAKYMPASYMAASLLSSILNITVSFLGYKWFVFKTKGNYLKEWSKCLMVYSASIVLGLALLPPAVLAVSYLTKNPSSAPYIAGALLMGFNVIISFVGHKKFSFRQVQAE